MVYPRGQYWVQSCLTSSVVVWVMRSMSVPSASLLMTQNWEEWLIHLEGHAAIQRHLDRLDWWQPHAAQQREVQSSACGTSPDTGTGCGLTGEKVALQKRTWGSWWTPVWT